MQDRIRVNIYRDSASLFINGEVIISAEGTTQGDPMAMAMYAIGIMPLIQRLRSVNSTKQIWYADDCTGCGSLEDLSDWWNTLSNLGPLYGYFPNSSKSTLLVKPEHLDKAGRIFHNSDIKLVLDGVCVLGAPNGSCEFISTWITNKVLSWVDEITPYPEIC